MSSLAQASDNTTPRHSVSPLPSARALADEYEREIQARHAREAAHEAELWDEFEIIALRAVLIIKELGWGGGNPVADTGIWIAQIAEKNGITDPSVPPRPRRAGTFSRTVQRRIWDRDSWECQIRLPGCLGHRDLTIDHIIAVINGGGDEDDNLQTACRPCNIRKRDK